MIHTRVCDLLGIAHPIVLGGMGGATTAPLVAAAGARRLRLGAQKPKLERLLQACP